MVIVLANVPFTLAREVIVFANAACLILPRVVVALVMAACFILPRVVVVLVMANCLIRPRIDIFFSGNVDIFARALMIDDAVFLILALSVIVFVAVVFTLALDVIFLEYSNFIFARAESAEYLSVAAAKVTRLFAPE